MTEVFKSQCSQDDSKSFCFDKFINELQKNSSNSGVKLYYIVIGNKIILLFSFERKSICNHYFR